MLNNNRCIFCRKFFMSQGHLQNHITDCAAMTVGEAEAMQRLEAMVRDYMTSLPFVAWMAEHYPDATVSKAS